MDAGIADTLNRVSARGLAAHFDELDDMFGNSEPWYDNNWARLLALGGPPSSDVVWLLACIGARNPEVPFDGAPAGCDWDNLFSHFRAEIQARRDRDSSPVRAAEIPAPSMV